MTALRFIQIDFNYDTQMYDVIENNKILKSYKREMNAINYEMKLNKEHYLNAFNN